MHAPRPQALAASVFLALLSGAASAATATPVVSGTAEIQKPYLDSASAEPGYSRWVTSDTLGVPVVVDGVGGVATGSNLHATTSLSARADALRGTLQTRFTLTSLGAYDDRSSVGFSKIVQVQAGSSGLADGDAVTLNVLLRLEGSSHAGPPGVDPSLPQATTDGRWWYSTYGERYLASTDVYADYTVRDLSQQVCTEGCRPAEVIGFGYRAHVLYDTLYGAEVTSSWTAAQPFTQVSGTPSPQSFNGDTNVGYFGAFGWDAVDTGVIRLQIDTHIGSFLQMTGEISSLLQTNGMKVSAQAVLAFGHTFDVDVRPTVAGVAIAGELPTIAAVPEPAAWALWGAGLAGMAGGSAWRRRRA